MPSPGPGAISDLRDNPAWQYACEVFGNELKNKNHNDLADPDPFEHGRAIGRRDKLEQFLGLIEELEELSEGKSKSKSYKK